MRATAFTIGIALLVVADAHAAALRCPGSAPWLNAHCYRRTDAPVAFDNATSACRQWHANATVAVVGAWSTGSDFVALFADAPQSVDAPQRVHVRRPATNFGAQKNA